MKTKRLSWTVCPYIRQPVGDMPAVLRFLVLCIISPTFFHSYSQQSYGSLVLRITIYVPSLYIFYTFHQTFHLCDNIDDKIGAFLFRHRFSIVNIYNTCDIMMKGSIWFIIMAFCWAALSWPMAGLGVVGRRRRDIMRDIRARCGIIMARFEYACWGEEEEMALLLQENIVKFCKYVQRSYRLLQEITEKNCTFCLN